MPCHMSDAAVLVARTSLPFGAEVTFFDEQIRPLFADHKKRLLANMQAFTRHPEQQQAIESFERFFYLPMPYATLGRFDQITLSLIDDYELAQQSFRPFVPADRDRPAQTFAYQTLVCPLPRFNSHPNGPISAWCNSLGLECAERTSAPRRLPLLALCQVKINASSDESVGLRWSREVAEGVVEGDLEGFC